MCALLAQHLDRCEVETLAAANWPSGQVTNAVNVAWLESKWFTGAHATVGEDSRGVWQINVAVGAHPELAVYNLYDPVVNAQQAYLIYVASGWGAWYNSAHALGLI
jgi:hypothetical protein